ncbi:orotidine-5'-phosphate decarboxylase [uncultured Corynebacterium sp.]|uniref:orotidine-5'-phosphate decarboxylase n=1 Tax=uncultured Corynebacterium sp. TaxID=159447 RepID=UPI0025D37BC1|nr:orotidine-5'-phosphate decarboxylase [uncultured Corynebacterium sp.]
MADSPHGGRADFGSRLAEVTARRGRLCVGIDPHPALLRDWGLSVDAAGVETFTNICVEAFAGTVALVKPQVAFYESHGSRGFAILERALSELSDGGALTVADAKRGDIGSTMAAYADAWLSDGSPLAADAVTVSPYLGFGSLEPALSLAEETGRGVFVLAATSNPEGASVQGAVVKRDDGDRASLAQDVVDRAARRNAPHVESGAPTGPVGVVIGATLESAPALDALAGPILMPGVGAQGAGAADVARLAGDGVRWALPNISRGILRHGPHVGALTDAVARAAAEFPA